MAYVTSDAALFDINVKKADLGMLGPGFPLFFVLLQYLIGYMFGLTIVYFLPVAFSINAAVEDLESKGVNIESKIAMWSYGAFVHATNEADLDFESR